MSDLVSRVLAAIEAKQQKARAVQGLGVLLDWPRRNGKATLRAFLEDNDPVAVIDRCDADRRMVELFQYHETRYKNRSEASATNRLCRHSAYFAAKDLFTQVALGYRISVEEETTDGSA